jgi:hypothetical protein
LPHPNGNSTRIVSGVRLQRRAFALAIVARPDLKDFHHDPTSILLTHHPAPPRWMTHPLLKVTRLELLHLLPFPFPVQVRCLLPVYVRCIYESIVRQPFLVHRCLLNKPALLSHSRSYIIIRAVASICTFTYCPVQWRCFSPRQYASPEIWTTAASYQHTFPFCVSFALQNDY